MVSFDPNDSSDGSVTIFDVRFWSLYCAKTYYKRYGYQFRTGKYGKCMNLYSYIIPRK